MGIFQPLRNDFSLSDFQNKKRELAKLELQKIKDKIDMRKCESFLEGDKPTKCFFQNLTPNDLKPNRISELCDDKGDMKNGLEDMLSVASKYYENLYRCEEIDAAATEMFLANINLIPDSESLGFLCSEFHEDELKNAISSFKNGKSPGPDGLSIEFYKSVFFYNQR